MGKYVLAFKGGSMPETEEEQKQRDGRLDGLVRQASATRSSTSATRSAPRRRSAAAPRQG